MIIHRCRGRVERAESNLKEAKAEWAAVVREVGLAAVDRELGIRRQAVAQRLRPIEDLVEDQPPGRGRNIERIENHVILHELFGGGIYEEPAPCWGPVLLSSLRTEPSGGASELVRRRANKCPRHRSG